LATLIADQSGARLPGDKRHDHRRAAARNGIDVPEELATKLRDYAGRR
jgi:LDH2 family malate/lactate/ureidoglycolate dehydrogenase